MYHRAAAVRISLLPTNHSTKSYFYIKFCLLILAVSCVVINNSLLIAPASPLVNSVPLFLRFHAFYASLDCFCFLTTVLQGSVFSHSVYHQNAGRKSWTLGLFFSPNFLSVVFLCRLSVRWNFFCWRSVVQKYLFFPFLVKMFYTFVILLNS